LKSSPPARRTNRAVTVLGLVLAMAMAALEATVVSTAMPSVVGDLGAIDLYAWVTTAYLLTSSVTVPIYGKLADMYGRKPVLLFGIVVFLVGSALSGASTTMTQLILFRALQGVGAGAMQPIALTVVGDIFDLSERARIQGVFGAFWGFFGMTGPAIGGYLVKVKYLGWRSVFYVNLPFGVIASLLIIFALHENVDRRPRRLDYAGALVLTSGLVALLLATSRTGGSVATWAAVAAVVLLGSFPFIEKRAAEPVLPLSLFRRRLMLIAAVSGSIVGGAMVATTTFVPLFVQAVLHMEPTQAGAAFTPMLVGWPIASTLGGRLIPRIGFRPLIRGGLGTTAAAAIALALFGEHGGLTGLQIITGVFGVGMGFANTALIIAVQTSVAWQERGIATASTMFFRTIGGALAVSAMGAVLITALTRDGTVSLETASKLLAPDASRDPALMERASAALSLGIGWIFWLIAAMATVSFIAALWFPYVPTKMDLPADVPAGH
jgi:EmrB/QacA subfamily drug resistance transporter